MPYFQIIAAKEQKWNKYCRPELEPPLSYLSFQDKKQHKYKELGREPNPNTNTQP